MSLHYRTVCGEWSAKVSALLFRVRSMSTWIGGGPMRTRLELLQEWDQQLGWLLPGERKTRVKALAAFALGVMISGSVTLLKVAHSLPLGAADASVERRLRRWLANGAVSVEAMRGPLVRALLAGYRDREVALALDPTPRRGSPGGVYVLGLVAHKRVLPLAWHTLADRRELNEPERVFVGRMCRLVAGSLPEGCEVTLLADSGLTGPDLVRTCEELGWHWVLRLSADAKQSPKLRDGATVWGLATGPGQRLYREAELLRRMGWRRVGLSIHWRRGCDEPWILISDRPAGYARVREYRKRWQAESTFQDCKRRGWGLDRSRVADPARLDRLLLALFIALWWSHDLGLRAIRAGKRRLFDRPGRRDLSVVRLGRCLMDHLLGLGKLPPTPLRPGVRSRT